MACYLLLVFVFFKCEKRSLHARVHCIVEAAESEWAKQEESCVVLERARRGVWEEVEEHSPDLAV